MEIRDAQNTSQWPASSLSNAEDVLEEADDFYPMTEAQKSDFERTIRQAPRFTVNGENWYRIPLTEDARKYYKSLLLRFPKNVED